MPFYKYKIKEYEKVVNTIFVDRFLICLQQ